MGNYCPSGCIMIGNGDLIDVFLAHPINYGLQGSDAIFRIFGMAMEIDNLHTPFFSTFLIVWAGALVVTDLFNIP